MKNLYKLIVFILITVGAIARFINIKQPLLEFFPQRQTQTAEITRNIYKNGWPDFWTPKVRYFTNGEPIPYVLEFPVYNGLIVVLYHLFGPNVIWGRIVSLTFFVLSSIIFYRLVSKTIPAISAILAILFFSFSPLHILTGRSFQPEELVLFLLLLAVYKKSWLVFSLAILTKLPILLFAPVMLYRSSLSRNNFIKLALSIIPPIAWYYRAGQLTIHPAIARNFELSNWFQPLLWLNPRWYFSLFQIEHIWILTTLGLLFFWLGLWQIILSLRGSPSVNRVNLVFWLVWLLSGLFYLAIFNYHAMTHEYYHLLLLPPLSIFVGTGLSQIVKITKGYSRNIRVISITGIILLFIMGLIQPAIKKVISAPMSPEKSEEVTASRYRLIEDF